MTLSKEMMARAKKAASAEELAALAEAEGFFLTGTEAEELFCFLRAEGELDDSELDMVAGGKGEPAPRPEPRFKPGQRFQVCRADALHYVYGTVVNVDRYVAGYGYLYCFRWDSKIEDTLDYLESYSDLTAL